MCELCAATGTFDPSRHPVDSDFATIFEGVDAPASTSTPYAIDPGDMFVGSVGFSGDLDAIGITLTAGQTYTFTVSGAGGGGGTLSDSILNLYDNNGTFIESNDDFGGSYDSQITFEATYSGTYYLGVEGWGSSTGTYTLSATPGSTPPGPGPTPPSGGAGTVEQLADYLVNGYWDGTGRSARQFDTSSDNEITVNISGLTSDGQQLALWALEAWELVADLEFVVVNGSADINFDDSDSGAYNISYTSGGVITSSDINVSTNWLVTSGTTIDSYSFQTYVHEIGHALGLGHQGGYNSSATYGIDDTFTNDSWQVSVMSYFNQSENTTVNASYARLLTPMMADIYAIQSMYGASNVTAGNTVWGANSTLGGYIAEVFAEMAGESTTSAYNGGGMAFTIYDDGGHDTLDLSYLTSGANIDMRAGAFSDMGGLIGNLAIAAGTVIEDLITGSGNDTIQGNDADNSITSGGGNDSVEGGDGNDSILGGDGFDTLIGDSGNDTIRGQEGNDSIVGGSGNDRLWGGAGDDIISGGSGNDIIGGGSGNDDLSGGTGNDSIYGASGNDTIDGGSGVNVLWGGQGDDRVTAGDEGGRIGGGAGDDTLTGGDGDDTIYGGSAFGNDSINGGAGDDVIWGGNGEDTLFGGSGDDFIGAGLLDDRIDAGPGDDTVRGGGGADTFVFDDGDDDLTIEDFSFAEDDMLELDAGLWGGGPLTAAQVLSTYGNVTGGNLVLDFGGGDIVILEGITNTSTMASHIDIV